MRSQGGGAGPLCDHKAAALDLCAITRPRRWSSVRSQGGGAGPLGRRQAGVVVQPHAAERVAERLAEVAAHGAVQHEVDGRVDEHEDVHDVAERPVHLVDERRQDAAQQAHDALRELSDEEQHDDREQHGRRAVGGALAVRVAHAVRHVHLPPRALHLLHCPQQEQAEHREAAARDQLHDDRLDPEVERVHQPLRRRLHPQRDDPHGAGDVTHLVDRHHEQVRHAHDERGEPHEEDRELGAPHAAVALPVVRVAHADVPEDGECDGEPDRHGVHDDAEACVEEQEAHGRK